MESSEVMVESFLDGVEITQGIYKTKEKVGSIPPSQKWLQATSFSIIMLNTMAR